jgi:hypothetical protein
MVGYSESFQGGYCLYDPITHCVTEHHEAIFDEPVPHGPPRISSITSFLNDDYQHVSMEHASSSLTEFLLMTLNLL